MKIWIILTFFFCFNIVAGDGRGDGGGIYYCNLLDNNKDKQIFSIDFLHMLKNIPDRGVKLFSKKSCNEILSEISLKLSLTDPILSAGLGEFINLKNTVISSSVDDKKAEEKVFENNKRVAYKTTSCRNTIPYSKDDQVCNDTPRFCGKIALAYRTQPDSKKIKTQFNGCYLNKLEKEGIQCAYFWLHEWARDFFKNANDIRFFLSRLFSNNYWDSNFSILGLLPPHIISSLPKNILTNCKDVVFGSNDNYLELYHNLVKILETSKKVRNKCHVEEEKTYMAIINDPNNTDLLYLHEICTVYFAQEDLNKKYIIETAPYKFILVQHTETITQMENRLRRNQTQFTLSRCLELLR